MSTFGTKLNIVNFGLILTVITNINMHKYDSWIQQKIISNKNKTLKIRWLKSQYYIFSYKEYFISLFLHHKNEITLNTIKFNLAIELASCQYNLCTPSNFPSHRSHPLQQVQCHCGANTNLDIKKGTSKVTIEFKNYNSPVNSYC